MDRFLQQPPRLADSWASDRVLRETVRFYLGDEGFAAAEPELAAMGRWAVEEETLTGALAAENERPRHIPYSAWGERIDLIEVSSFYKSLGRAGVVAGVTAIPYETTPYGPLARVMWAALHQMWGPSSGMYSCPVAMTDAAARTLLVHGGPSDLDAVGHLTSRDPDVAWTSGQWMTETAGGSDVGRTGTVARLDADGYWRLTGTKWFTSATTSEMALTLARPEGAPMGSRGLSLFRIHRTLDDGRRNSILVRRLKDKLGTRSLPTAELELEGAIAFPVGDPTDGGGVRRIATMLNLTRLHNALGASGALARGLGWARAYAEVREVFGKPLWSMPAHRATLADLAVDYHAAIALVFRCAELTGRAEHQDLTGSEQSLLRGLTPLVKLATAKWAVAGCTEAMESVGGVGYCEDSGIPAMVRNAHVLPIWEGTTNVLSLDLLRAGRSGDIEALLNDALASVEPLRSDASVAVAAAAVAGAVAELGERFTASEDVIESNARSLALGIALTYACARLCVQGAWAAHSGDGRTAAAATRLSARGLVPPPAPARDELSMDEPLAGADSIL